MGQPRTPLGRKPANNKPVTAAFTGLKRKAEDADEQDVKRIKTVTPSKAREEELIEWRRKMHKSIKNWHFYLDLDPKSTLELTQAVTDLGGVSPCSKSGLAVC
jgi:hypothetical protein